MEIDGRRFEVSATQFSRATACLSYEFGGRTGLCFSRPAGITCFDDNGETRSFDHQQGLPKAAMQGLAIDRKDASIRVRMPMDSTESFQHRCADDSRYATLHRPEHWSIVFTHEEC